MYEDLLTSLYGELRIKRLTPALLRGKAFEEAEVLFVQTYQGALVFILVT